jgi:predicted flap endonuclease-1-like 5' DNA nuclease
VVDTTPEMAEAPAAAALATAAPAVEPILEATTATKAKAAKAKEPKAEKAKAGKAKEPKSAKKAAKAPKGAGAGTGVDELERIEGVGPKMAEALRAGGIGTFAELARASDDQLQDALRAAGLRFAPSLTTWAEQAGYLARGDEDGFRVLTDKLVAGRARRPK